MFPERNAREAVEAIHRRLTAAIAAAAGELAAVEPGRLVSLSLPLPIEAEGTGVALDGDSRWLGPHGGLRIEADGEAAGFDTGAARRFDAERRRWHRLGTADAPPLAFFTVPPATAPALPRIRVPRIAVRTGGGAPAVILSAWWNGGPPETITRAWLGDVRRIVAGETQQVCGAPLHILSTEADPSAAVWERRVRAAAQAVEGGRLAKVVLARRLSLKLSWPADPARVADALARVNPECCVFSLPCGAGRVIAASPELLAVKRGDRLVSHALAGTARRHDGPDEDAAAAAALMASAKERREHAVVVEAIARCLAGLCETVESLPEPSVMPLRFVQHLWTPIAGRLRPDIGLIDAVARLHPTPAVLGSPPLAAIEWLRDIGERRDGLYTGVAGWIDRDGDGDAAVVLRSAYLEDRTAVLWAGAGIMADSDPQAEFAETEMKLASLMEVLNAP